MTPEGMVGFFNSKLNNLFKSTLALGDEKIDSGFKKIMKKTVVSQILYDRYVVAISGLQGVGKSTILKQLYDISEDYIPEVLGIGEKIPVLITEHDSKEFLCKVKRFVQDPMGEYSIEDYFTDKETFKAIAMNPGVEDILLELLVPYRYFHTPTQSFMLLPGLHQSQDEWDSLAHHALSCSSTCIMVFNEASAAGGANANLVSKIQRDFEKSKPILALTFADQSKDQNMGLKNQVMETFNIPKEEEDRVIRTGTTKELRDRWIGELIGALRKYSSVEKEFRKSQIDILDSILTKDLGDLTNLIKVSAYEYKINNEVKKNLEVEKLMDIIKKQQKLITDDYKKDLKNSLNGFAAVAANKLDGNIIDRSFWKKLLISTFGEDLKERRKFEATVEKAWSDANKDGYDKLPIAIIGKIVEESNFDKPKRFAPALKSPSPSVDEAAVGLEQSSRPQISDEVVDSLRALFVPDNDSQVPSHAVDSIKYAPYLALEALRMREIAIVNEEIKLSLRDEKSLNKGIGLLMDQMGYASEQRGNLLKGVGLIMGLDAVDGTINTIPILLNALGIKTAVVASSAVVTAFGLLGIGILAINLVSQVNKYEIQSSNQGKQLIQIIRNNYYNAYCENFEDSINKMYNMFEERLNLTFRVNEAQSRVIRIEKNLADITSLRAEMREVINGYRCYLA